jgi:hypothetical protein
MNNPAIEQALKELEDSLSQIKSANENVNAVASKAEKMTQSMASVLTAINNLSKKLQNESETQKVVLEENSDLTIKGFDKILKNAQNKYSKFETEFVEQRDNFSTKLNEVSTSFEKQVNELLNSVIASTNNSQSTIIDKISQLEHSVDSAQVKLLSFEKVIIELENQIIKTDFRKEFNHLNQSFQKKHNTLMALNAVIILVLMALLFLR